MLKSVKAQYLVGIDLGTTHCCLSYCPVSVDSPSSFDIVMLPIIQPVGAGQLGEQILFPSLRYHSKSGVNVDSKSDAATSQQTFAPWGDMPLEGDISGVIYGEYARGLGGKTLGRVVTSAKSWLSHSGVDRQAPILPRSDDQALKENNVQEGVPLVSPVMASASYLHYLKNAWNHRFPEAPLEEQEVVVTVPASFDDMARLLTIQAAVMAGLSHVQLLEEPIAACYDWLASSKNDKGSARPLATAVNSLLVCDIGGGTTDFSLIRVGDSWDEPLERMAIGPHLMLGGDNLDLALAKQVERQLKSRQQLQKLSVGQLTQLMAQTKAAKERLLSDPTLKSVSVTIQGKGSRLIAGQLSAEITQETVTTLLLEGFFPEVDFTQKVESAVQSAISEFGLPYAKNPAITEQLRSFLQEQCLAQANTSTQLQLPDAVLFNGGLFKSRLLIDRMEQQLSQWCHQLIALEDDSLTSPIHVLSNPNPEYAVARGAVAYLLSQRGVGPSIASYLPRHYFCCIEDKGSCDEQVDYHLQMNPSQIKKGPQAVCVLPKGSRVDEQQRLDNRTFILRLNQRVQLSLVSSIEPRAFELGQLVSLTELTHEKLPPVVTCLSSQDVAQGRRADAEILSNQGLVVTLSAQATQLGTVSLFCDSHLSLNDNVSRWAFRFDSEFRDDSEMISSTKKVASENSVLNNSTVGAKSIPPVKMAQAITMIEQAYGVKTSAVKAGSINFASKLRGQLEKVLGDRESWNIEVLRSLADCLLLHSKRRRRTASHERVWLLLLGFCLRPGFGVAEDIFRVEQCLLLLEQGLQYKNEDQNIRQWWVFWRRISGGLSSNEQQYLCDKALAFFDATQTPQKQSAKRVTSKKNQKKSGKKNKSTERSFTEHDEVIRLVGGLERCTVMHKQKSLQLFSDLCVADPANEALWWAIGRLGARTLVNAERTYLLAASVIELTLDRLLTVCDSKMHKYRPTETALFALSSLARRTDLLEMNINEALRVRVSQLLYEHDAPQRWRKAVDQVVSMTVEDQAFLLGEALPMGLSLLD